MCLCKRAGRRAGRVNCRLALVLSRAKRDVNRFKRIPPEHHRQGGVQGEYEGNQTIDQDKSDSAVSFTKPRTKINSRL